jgi:CheY-like chemotaxis protein
VEPLYILSSTPLGSLIKTELLEEELSMPNACHPQCLEPELVSLNGKRVLAVDDNADNLDLVAFILEDAGGKVIKAVGAVEALEIMKHVKVDLLISDIVMPKVDGYELLNSIRSLSPEQGGLIPAVALTAHATKEARTLALQSGFQGFLTKPLEPELLVAVVAKLTLGNVSTR